MEHGGDDDTNYSWHARNSSQGLGKKTGRNENQMKTRKLTDNSIAKIILNIPMSPGNSRRLAVTQTPVKDEQLSWWEKTHLGHQ